MGASPGSGLVSGLAGTWFYASLSVLTKYSFMGSFPSILVAYSYLHFMPPEMILIANQKLSLLMIFSLANANVIMQPVIGLNYIKRSECALQNCHLLRNLDDENFILLNEWHPLISKHLRSDTVRLFKQFTIRVLSL